MLNTLQTLSVFGLIWVMTQRRPGRPAARPCRCSCTTRRSERLIGYGTAVALLLLLVGALFSVVYSAC